MLSPSPYQARQCDSVTPCLGATGRPADLARGKYSLEGVLKINEETEPSLLYKLTKTYNAV